MTSTKWPDLGSPAWDGLVEALDQYVENVEAADLDLEPDEQARLDGARCLLDALHLAMLRSAGVE